jgi:hypothetical protein
MIKERLTIEGPEIVARLKRQEILAMRGCGQWEGDLGAMRDEKKGERSSTT